MAKFINKRIYTDIESWLVTEIDEARGTAMATPVKKIIRPKMVPGGFRRALPGPGPRVRRGRTGDRRKAFPDPAQ